MIKEHRGSLTGGVSPSSMIVSFMLVFDSLAENYARLSTIDTTFLGDENGQDLPLYGWPAQIR
jgi:hypothetical protein